MKRILLLFLSLLMVALLSGCLNGSEGPALFSDGVKDPADTTEEETDVSPVEEFGFLVPKTLCVKQLHGGCVPSDFTLYDSDLIGLHFMKPVDWVNVSASDVEVSFAAPSEAKDDVTRLFVWRSAASDIARYQETVNQEVADAGTAVMGPYAVKWEIYEGMLKDQPVKGEWVTLTMDEYNPWINFVFFLVTEPENFLTDQNALKGAVSSVLANTPGLVVTEDSE